ncbi:MAG: hypothetical protein CL928_16715 [Deltaproteobacteria bacterium]|nr:hypothetical protein [Deltaproteobacteria bacterium]
MTQTQVIDAGLKRLGTQLVLGVQVYLRALRTYQSNNAMVVQARDQLEDLLTTHFKDNKAPLQLQFLEGETFLNGNLLSVDFQSFLRAQELTRLLRSFDVGEVTFSPNVTRVGLEQFAEAIYACIHQKAETLPEQFEGLTLQALHSAGVGASGAEIHRGCVWLFSGLLSAIDSLSEIHDEDLVPSMVPFTRHLRLLTEIIDERPTVFQLLCSQRPATLEEGDSLHCTLRTVEAVGFGVSLGLSRSALMTLGLASILDRVTAHQGSAEVFQQLSRYQSLGDMAPGVMMTLWDLELIRNGSKGGRLAQLLHLIDNYVTLSQPVGGGSEEDVADVWSRMQRAVPTARSFISALRSWKGRVPIGSMLVHPELGQSLVLDHSGPDRTPRLSPFSEWGVLAEPVAGLEIPKGISSRFGKSHELRLPKDVPHAAKSTPPFPVAGRVEDTTLEPGGSFGGRKGDRFVVEELAGKGGQAVIYRVRDTRLGRLAAAKVALVSDSSQRQKFLERFERELMLSSRVSHPHVLQVYDCGELDGGTPYVLLEWMERGDLVGLLKNSWKAGRSLPLEYVRYYGLSVASALRSVHAAGIVHRDVKPDNILLRADGVAKLTDFGIAKDISEGAIELTEVGQTMGTLGFMAPEHLLGLPGPQSDIFSFGVTLYRLICSRTPAQVKVNSVPSGRILEEAWEGVPSNWEPLLRRLTAAELEERAKDFDEVIGLLRDLEDDPGDHSQYLRVEELPPLPSAEFGVVMAPVLKEGSGPHSISDMPATPSPEEDWEGGTAETMEIPSTNENLQEKTLLHQSASALDSVSLSDPEEVDGPLKGTESGGDPD